MAAPNDREAARHVAAGDVAPPDGLASSAESPQTPALEAARVTAPNITAPAVEAAGLPPAEVAPRAAAVPCEGKLQQIIAGYEPGIPLAGGEVKTRALRVLERAFPEPCYSLTLTSMRREDLAPSIVKGKIDVGVVTIPAASSFTDRQVNVLPASDDAGVDLVMLQPASYSVVAAKREVLEELASDHASAWLLLPLGVLAGVVSLVFSTYLLNFRVARGPDVALGHTRIDPRLARLGSAVHWMYSATSGRLLSAIWAGLGAILVVQLASTEDVVHAALERNWRPLDGAEQAAYPGRDIYELREEHWTKCSQPYECLHNYQRGVTQALAGDRDVLCRYEAQSHSTTFEFVDDVAVPLLYALLLPPAATSAPTAARSIEDRVIEALRLEPYAGSPFSACSRELANVAERE